MSCKKLIGWIFMQKLFFLFCLVFCLVGFNQYTPATIVRVIDGDTLIISQDKKNIRVRLYGIDTPEIKQDYGECASAFLKELLPVGSTIFLDIITVDFYKRSVAIVKLQDKRILQEILLQSGNAWLYKKYCSAQMRNAWQPLEDHAQKNKLGIFADPNAEPPWNWRRKKN